ncbi:adenosine deaminase [Pararoseomonas indoligenes]|uniref:Adenosine deaminase n=1 Tax=Roseomonas indoligenes TaxID=2820811 RepID=A0A940N734_9PROT|nr:adenosine deaminase [Pararoseomonas indoligenes]MBP0495307.1 adenosine deaminase [Pararoseomonas indoligenes]
MISFSDYLDLVPKVELHCHIAGAVRATTLHEIAQANGVRLPRPAETLYQWPDFYGFLEVLRLGALAIRRREDFERVAYECIEDMHRHGNARHVEIFFNPHYYSPNGATYPLIVEGLVAGLERAERDLGVSSLMIACIDRSVCLPSEALQMLDWVQAHPHPRVVGIGLDGAERAGPPLVWVEAWRRAGRMGLRRTAHVCEDNQALFEGPPAHITHCRDALGCDRLDHGYNMLADPDIVARMAREGVPFTMACWSSIPPNRIPRLDRIRRMAEAGLTIVLGTDDPTMFGTNMGHAWRRVFDHTGWGVAEARRLSLAGVEACWLPDPAKAALRADFETRLDALDAALDPSDRAVDVAVERA